MSLPPFERGFLISDEEKRERDRRLQILCEKFKTDEVLRQIPTRISPDIVFSEDEESESNASTAASSDCDLKDATPPISGRRRTPLKCLFPSLSDNGSSSEFKQKPSYVEASCSFVGGDFNQVYSDTLKRIERLGTKKTSSEQQCLTKKAKEVSTVHFAEYGGGASCAENIAYKDDKILEVSGKKYEVLSMLGSGGSCKVYAVIARGTSDMFAIKCVDLGKGDQELVNNFMKEIEYLKMLQNSEHVIRLYDYEYCVGEKGQELLYLVLEKGETDLAKFLSAEKKKRSFTPLTIKFYWSQMINAVADIHSLGIVHSDLKPANFLLVSGHLKLIDFGIAASVPGDKTSILRESAVGTVSYMSPEAVSISLSDNKGYKISVKSDVWSLGCILYDMVYGATPFSHIKNIVGKVQAITDPNYDIPFPPINDQHLLHVLKSCLVRNPHKRASVQELLDHPYLTRESETLGVSKDISDLISQIQALTPRRMSTVSDVIKQLSRHN